MTEDISFGIHVFCEGKNLRSYEMLGLHKTVKDGKECMVMRTWAPFARAVSLVGEFSGWKENKYPLKRIDGGIWEVYTDCVAIQFYAGNFIDEVPQTGKGDFTYGNRSGLCLETGFLPNAINLENFASPILKANEKYHSKTIYKFNVI